MYRQVRRQNIVVLWKKRNIGFLKICNCGRNKVQKIHRNTIFMFTRAVSIYDSKQGGANDSNIEVEVNNQSIKPVYTDLLLSHTTYFTLQTSQNILRNFVPVIMIRAHQTNLWLKILRPKLK